MLLLLTSPEIAKSGYALLAMTTDRALNERPYIYHRYCLQRKHMHPLLNAIGVHYCFRYWFGMPKR